MPDALSKTVPIWCAVINLALHLRRQAHTPLTGDSEGSSAAEWDTLLYLPANIVSPSEKAQIESHLLDWAETLKTSAIPLPDLAKPLRPFFTHPSTSYPPQIPVDPPYTPIICVSASRWLGIGGDDVPSVTELGHRTVGFEYVPGAGDDDELWARGLTPAMYHSTKEDLLAVLREDLPSSVDEIMEGKLGAGMTHLNLGDKPDDISATSSFMTGIPHPESRLGIDLGPTAGPSMPTWTRVSETHHTLRILQVDKAPRDTPTIIPLDATLSTSLIILPNPRVDGRAYATALQVIIECVTETIDKGCDVLLVPGRPSDLEFGLKRLASSEAESTAEVSDEALERTDLVDAKKAILPVILALLCSVPHLRSTGDVDKKVIASHLHRLVSLWPDGNPPRVALKRVNGLLMGGERD